MRTTLLTRTLLAPPRGIATFLGEREDLREQLQTKGMNERERFLQQVRIDRQTLVGLANIWGGYTKSLRA